MSACKWSEAPFQTDQATAPAIALSPLTHPFMEMPVGSPITKPSPKPLSCAWQA